MTAFGNVSVYRDNPSNAGPPTIGDDSSLGYTPGSRWYDATGKALYMCTDATAGAAVWLSILGEPPPSTGTVAGANMTIAGPASGGDNNGGAITIEGGAKAGGGTIGSVLLLGIPATDPAVFGALYGAAGAVSISGG